MRVVQRQTEDRMICLRTSLFTWPPRPVRLLKSFPHTCPLYSENKLFHFSKWEEALLATIKVCPQVPTSSCFHLGNYAVVFTNSKVYNNFIAKQSKKDSSFALCTTCLSYPSSICPVYHHAVHPVKQCFSTSLEQISIFLSVLPLPNPHIICYRISSGTSQIY